MRAATVTGGLCALATPDGALLDAAAAACTAAPVTWGAADWLRRPPPRNWRGLHPRKCIQLNHQFPRCDAKTLPSTFHSDRCATSATTHTLRGLLPKILFRVVLKRRGKRLRAPTCGGASASGSSAAKRAHRAAVCGPDNGLRSLGEPPCADCPRASGVSAAPASPPSRAARCGAGSVSPSPSTRLQDASLCGLAPCICPLAVPPWTGHAARLPWMLAHRAARTGPARRASAFG